MEDKENNNPIVSSTGEDSPVKGVILMEFNSPEEQSEPKSSDQQQTTTSEQSPKRPVLKEIKVDLFGLISPDQKSSTEEENSLKNLKASDLLSMSIFQTSPASKESPKINTSISNSGETYSVEQNVTADTSSILSTSLLFNQSVTFQSGDGDLDSSIISTHQLFNQSLNQSLNLSQTYNESCSDSNSTMNKTMQLSVIDSSILPKNEIEFSVTYDNFESEAKDCEQETSIVVDKSTSFVAPMSTDNQQQVNNDNVDSGASSLKDEDHVAEDVPMQDSSLLETKLVYESQIVELNARIDELEEQLHNKANQSVEPDDAVQAIAETPFSMGDSVNLIKTKHDYESIIESLNQRIQQLLKENRETKLKFEEVTLKESSNAELQTSMVQNDLEITFTLEDRVNLLETKLAYEKQIVDLEEKVEQLQSQIDSQQLSATISPEKPSELTIGSDDSFIIDKLVDQLLDTKLAHENEIDNLREKLAQLTSQIAQCEAKEQHFNEELKSVKQHHEADVQEHEGKIDIMRGEIESLKSRLGQQDAHYVRLVSELESTIADLRSNLSEYHEKYELSLVPKYESLKTQFQELTMKQLESEDANQNLLESITDMDEQRNSLRSKLERANEQAALQAEQLETVRGQLAQAQQQLKSTTETTLPRLEQLEVANRILSSDLSARDSKCAELEAENELLKTQLAQTDLNLREVKALQAAQAESAEQQLKKVQEEVLALQSEQLSLQENNTQLQTTNVQLSEAKDALEKALSKAQAGELTEKDAKKQLEKQLAVSRCQAKKLEESLCAEQQARDTLLLPAKEKLTETVEKFTKMSASITKLLNVMKTSSCYKEMVPSEDMKKVLYNVRYKVNSTVVEASQVLGLKCDIVHPPVAGGSKKATEKEKEEEENLSDDISPLVGQQH